MKGFLFSVFLAFAIMASGQDSVNTERKLTHEIGFNSVLLIKQLISNNPSNTLDQLPYQLIYTMGFNESRYGLRAWIGLDQLYTETMIDGQTEPRKTNALQLDGRLGVNYNFLKAGNWTGNFFADGVFSKSDLKSVTVTEFPFGDIQEETFERDVNGVGGQIGVGLKYSLHKNVALYVEVPIQVIAEQSRETDSVKFIQGNQVISETTNISKSDGVSTTIFLPTTLFLTITF